MVEYVITYFIDNLLVFFIFATLVKVKKILSYTKPVSVYLRLNYFQRPVRQLLVQFISDLLKLCIILIENHNQWNKLIKKYL